MMHEVKGVKEVHEVKGVQGGTRVHGVETQNFASRIGGIVPQGIFIIFVRKI